MFYSVMKHVLVGPMLKLAYRPKVAGLHHLPESGPVIIAGNHLAVIDSFLVPLVTTRQVFFLGKSDYVTQKGVKGRAKALFMKGVGMVPVDRSGGKASEAALQAGLKVLADGDIFALYPEGTRSPDGRLYRGKTGVARLALASGAPVVPVVTRGSDIAQPAGRVIPKFMSLGIEFGKPLDFSRYRAMSTDRLVLRAVTDEIMYAIMRLSGQEYVDMYAATVKARIKAAQAMLDSEDPLGTQVSAAEPVSDTNISSSPDPISIGDRPDHER